jgi:ketosteroid isomerase-like protein
VTESERLIRRGYDAWNRGDWAGMEELLAPDFEVDATDRVLNPDRYEGIAGFRRLAGEMAEIWDTWVIEPLEIIVNGERTFVAHSVRARGKGSGVEVVQTYWSVWTVRDGRGVKLSLFVDRGRALAAAGVPDGA